MGVSRKCIERVARRSGLDPSIVEMFNGTNEDELYAQAQQVAATTPNGRTLDPDTMEGFVGQLFGRTVSVSEDSEQNQRDFVRKLFNK